ncbi:MAG: carbohydrate-binding domain-containing protein [Oscillospiraceae bacterium]|nr:carbohydrate-binding domain-containing protein [Oscillospiraceae bacterium]
MKKIFAFLLAAAMAASLSACDANNPANRENPEIPETSENEEMNDAPEKADSYENATEIVLAGNDALVDGISAAESDGPVTIGGDIIYYHDMDYYPSGNPYGEGDKNDKHTEAEAAKYALVTIITPGEYYITGELKGQIAVDLGENAKDDPDAKVTLIFGGADIECGIAPAVIFYNVYECADGENTTDEVDTSAAGANVIIADGTENNIKGSNVARIYKDNGEGKKLHKYDGAFYSMMSMNINGGTEGTGILNIEAENEGLNSEMHLTVNGGNININAKDDGINTNEDGVSVTTINGGTITIKGGLGVEGDGIDSNGWLTINGGTVFASGSGRTGDGGIDADMGITINGGSVVAFGSRNDAVKSGEGMTCAQFTFASVRSAGSVVKFLDAEGYGMIAEIDRDFQSLVLAGENLEKNKEYTLYVNDIPQEYSGNLDSWGAGTGGFGGGMAGNGGGREENAFSVPEGFSEWLESAKDIPEDIRAWLEFIEDIMSRAEGGFENGMAQGGTVPEIPSGNPNGGTAPEMPSEERPQGGFSGGFVELSPVPEDMTVFVITDTVWNFSGIFDSSEATGKEQVSFTVNGKENMEDLYKGDLPGITSVECGAEVDKESIQLTLEYIGTSEEITVSEICFLSDGYEAINGLFEGLEEGTYRLTIAVTAENEDFAGSSSFTFDVVG